MKKLSNEGMFVSFLAHIEDQYAVRKRVLA